MRAVRANGMLDENEYSNLHYWIKKVKGKAMECEIHEEHVGRKYHWANVSRAYLYDPDDWVSLCQPCHYYFDRRDLELEELVLRRGSEKVKGLAEKKLFRPPYVDSKRLLKEAILKLQ